MTSPPRVRIDLLGTPAVSLGGSPVHLPTRNALLLLARLAAEGPQAREQLAALLWPDADGERGRTNLRRTLAYARDAFGREVEVVASSGGQVALAAGVVTDLDEVRRALAAEPPAARLLAAAVAAWRGEFLEGVQADGEELDEWLAQQRALWSGLLEIAAERLVAARSRAGDVMGALEAVERWLAREPLAEAAHRERIRLHLVRGDLAAALDAYARCVELLRRELGVEPSPATRELAERARRGERPASEPARSRPEAPMVGREAEHAVLAAALERAADGAGEMVLVAGEPGIGKTRLLHEFAGWARAQGAEVVEMRPFPAGRRIAYHVVGDVLGELLAAGDTGPGAEVRLYRAAADRLAALAGPRPLALFVDDLQWADPDSLTLLAYAAGELARKPLPLLLVVAARDEELEGSRQLRDWVERLSREMPLTGVELRPLELADAERLARLWPGLESDPGVGLLEPAGGRPLLLVETLRHLALGGDPGAVPPAVREHVLARLRSLSEPALAIAEVSAVVERPAPLALLAVVAGVDGGGAEALQELLLKHVLAGEGEYAFSHELLRREAYAAIPFERRRALHARVLDLLEAAGAAAEAAHHAELAGELERAERLRLRAAAEAMSLPAYLAAADQFQAAIAINPSLAEAWLGLGRAQELSGRSDLAAETYVALAQRARAAGRAADEAAALIRLAELAGRDFGAGAPTELLEEAEDAASGAADEGLLLEAQLTAAQVMAYRGELGRALTAVDAVHRRARAVRRRDLVARCLNLGAFVREAAGDLDQALPMAERAVTAYRDLGEPLMALDSTGLAGATLFLLGRWREALRRVRPGLREAARLGNPWAVCNLSYVEGLALRDGGRLEEALLAAERGSAAALEAGFAPLHVLNGALAGRCLREMGDVEGALGVHGDLVAPARELPNMAYQCVMEELAADHAAAGDWEAAAGWAERSVRAWGEMRIFAFLSLWTVAEACLRAGLGFSMPVLPVGDRYRFVELRTRAVVARLSAASDEATSLMREAVAVAERLDLRGELADVRVFSA